MADSKDPDERRHRQTMIVAVLGLILAAGGLYAAYDSARSDHGSGITPDQPAETPSSASPSSPVTVDKGSVPTDAPSTPVSNDSGSANTVVNPPPGRDPEQPVAPQVAEATPEPCVPTLEEMPSVDAVRVTSPAEARRLSPGPSCAVGELGQPLVLTVRFCRGRAADFGGIGFKVSDADAAGNNTNHHVGASIQWQRAGGAFTPATAANSYGTFSVPSGSVRMRVTIDGGDRYRALSMRVCRIFYG
ncbi:MAG: hypothetical protein KYX69_10295 [Sphingomonas sp.]|uniref:hypothetical protein n=1 Tax=Sphingomonas sp. TaxID=28214 RepID=UPI0026153489|nr:hypothetical protein [Sphingomonas sp.]MDK2768092.1 hypothetical protein [Sphingomonas sp.]